MKVALSFQLVREATKTSQDPYCQTCKLHFRCLGKHSSKQRGKVQVALKASRRKTSLPNIKPFCYQICLPNVFEKIQL